MFPAHLAQRRIAQAACRGLGTGFVLGDADAAEVERDAECRANALAVREPVVGVGAESVVDVECVQRQALFPRPGMGEAQQDHGIESAAEGYRRGSQGILRAQAVHGLRKCGRESPGVGTTHSSRGRVSLNLP